MQFAFANVTTLGHDVRQWIGGRPRTPIFVVETHLNEADHFKTVQWLNARGFGTLGHAAAESPKAGANGGFMVIFPAHLHFHHVQRQVIDGCGWYAVMWSFNHLSLIMVTAYFKCGEGVQGKTNSALWAGLINLVTGVNQPCIIMGDFNITPGELMATTMNTVMQVQVVATEEETRNTGNELGWALVTNQISPDIKVTANWEVPFKPHAQLLFHLNKTLEPIAVNQLTRFNPAPKMENPTREWIQIEAIEQPVQWLDMGDNLVSRQVGSIYGRIERYVLQNLDSPTHGRGARLQYQR